MSFNFQRLTAFVLAATAAAPALAHMTMADPAPFGNPSSDPMGAGNFPCKGMDAFGAAAVSTTIAAGSTMNVTLAGSAVHGGGSCQFVISYDNGATFGVMDQVIGGCPSEAQKSFTVKVPADLPASDGAVFGWTWFNHIGNREMYMNCAKVAVTGGGSGATLPGMYVANVGEKANGCTTPEGTDVDFANPPCNPSGQVTIGSGGSGTPAPPADPAPADPAPADPAPVPADPAPVPSCPGAPPAGEPAAPAPADPAPAPSTGSGIPMFEKDKVFNTGDVVCYEGKTYKAQWWTTSHLPPGGAWVDDNGTC